eukprot:31535-Pelagococcus_subviridis.AAC.4
MLMDVPDDRVLRLELRDPVVQHVPLAREQIRAVRVQVLLLQAHLRERARAVDPGEAVVRPALPVEVASARHVEDAPLRREEDRQRGVRAVVPPELFVREVSGRHRVRERLLLRGLAVRDGGLPRSFFRSARARARREVPQRVREVEHEHSGDEVRDHERDHDAREPVAERGLDDLADGSERVAHVRRGVE